MLRARTVCSLLGFSTDLILHQGIDQVVENTELYTRKTSAYPHSDFGIEERLYNSHRVVGCKQSRSSRE